MCVLVVAATVRLRVLARVAHACCCTRIVCVFVLSLCLTCVAAHALFAYLFFRNLWFPKGFGLVQRHWKLPHCQV